MDSKDMICSRSRQIHLLLQSRPESLQSRTCSFLAFGGWLNPKLYFLNIYSRTQFGYEVRTHYNISPCFKTKQNKRDFLQLDLSKAKT